jgi:trehalose 6-phosphate phosphatase
MHVAGHLSALADAGPDLLVGLDFDGTLAPIVDDPDSARALPDAAGVITRLARRCRGVAIVTGRPVDQVLRLGNLEKVADSIQDGTFLVLGQYGNERWDAERRVTDSAPPPEGLDGFREALPGLLDQVGVHPWIEDKGLAVALHTRRLPEPAYSYGELLPVISGAAAAHGLVTEPGRQVIEVRGEGTDKGSTLRALVGELEAQALLFAGDDLGDLEAFRALDELRSAGLTTVKVCSDSEEESALAPLADIVVDGPTGVLTLLEDLTDLLTSLSASE